MTASPRLLIKNGLVADPVSGAAEPRDLLIEDGRIAKITAPREAADPGIAVHDASDRLILPGLVNAHTHGHANLVKGVAGCWSLEASLTHGPWLAGPRDPETVYLSTLIGAADMLLKGCTACFDLVYEFPRPTVEGLASAARAYADAGMRAVVAPMVADKTLFAAVPGLLDAMPDDLKDKVAGFGLFAADETLAVLEDIAGEKHSLPPHIGLALAPAIPHHCSDDFLKRCAAIAERHALPIHMHIAESRLQAVTALKLWGMSPVAHLARLGMLRKGFVAAHAVWADEDDLDLFARHDCAVAHVPASNFRLGSGIAPVRAMLDRGIAVGLATDGANSSDALSMLQAMRLASYASRAFDAAPDAGLSARETVRLATEAGSDVLGLDRAGRVEEGALADFIFFDLAAIDFVPLTDALNQIVTCADGASVCDVMVGGRFAVRSGKLVMLDMGDLRERARAAVSRLAEKTADARALAERLEPHVVAFARAASAEPLTIERLVRPEPRRRR